MWSGEKMGHCKSRAFFASQKAPTKKINEILFEKIVFLAETRRPTTFHDGKLRW